MGALGRIQILPVHGDRAPPSFSRMTSGAPTTVTVCLAEGSAVAAAAAPAPEAAIIAPIVNMEIIFIEFSP